MQQVYASEQYIPELKGIVRGAATIILTQPDEVEGLQSFCLLSGRPVHDPTVGIFQALAASPVDLNAWKLQRESIVAPIKHWRELQMSDVKYNGTQEIIAALGLAQAVWQNQGDDIPKLALMLAVAGPAYGSAKIMELEADNPGWLLYKGSLRTTLFLGAFKAGSFVVGLISRGIGVEERADKIVNGLREKQTKKIPPVQHLPRLDEMEPGALANHCGVIVFLHGLLSTDLGTFDVLIDVLRKQGLREEDFAFVGWPHDTLTQIEINAAELCDDIEYAVGPNATELPKIAFVCHSRGGLLARDAAATLYLRDWARWQKQIGGCVTFGTPHLGSGLADAPDDLIASFIAAGAWRGSGQFAALNDVLWVLKNNKVLEGVEDLRTLRGKLPLRNRDPFQKTLIDKERAARPTTERVLDIRTVGGRVTAGAKWYYDLAGKALAGVEHDVAVPLDSSCPRRFPRNEPPIECDHFSYFTEGQTILAHYGNVAQYLKDVLDWTTCEAGRLTKAKPAPESKDEAEWIVRNGVKIPKRGVPKLRR